MGWGGVGEGALLLHGLHIWFQAKQEGPLGLPPCSLCHFQCNATMRFRPAFLLSCLPACMHARPHNLRATRSPPYAGAQNQAVVAAAKPYPYRFTPSK